MKALLLPLILAALGTGGGIGTAKFLAGRVEPAEAGLEEAPPCNPPDSRAEKADGDENDVSGDSEFARMNNQFVIPVVEDGKVTSLVVLALSIEVTAGTRETVFEREPRLRDGFLQVLFDHANMGGFEGNFTEAGRLDLLRNGLRLAARETLGGDARDVLIVDIVRQDV